jgi:hypothetical protein
MQFNLLSWNTFIPLSLLVFSGDLRRYWCLPVSCGQILQHIRPESVFSNKPPLVLGFPTAVQPVWWSLDLTFICTPVDSLLVSLQLSNDVV